MAHILRVTDGTTTVNLATSPQILNEYSPKSADDGEEVKETARVTITGANIDAALTTLRSLNDLFEQARRYTRYSVGSKVYVEFDPGTSGTVRRSQLTDGKADANKDTLDSQWANYQIEIMLTWTRMGGWEWPETELPLQNGGGSGTGGRTVTNHNNGSYENWVKVAAADVDGDMPARVRLTLEHTYNVDPKMNTIHVHHKVDNVSTFTHIVEGESGTGGSNTADSAASGGSKKTLVWTGTTKQKLWEYTLPSALSNAVNHGKVQLIPRIDGVVYTDLYLQFQLRNQTGYTLVSEGALTPVPASYCMFALDTFRLPPGRTGGTNAPLILELWAQRLTAGTHTVELDFIQFSPVADQSWRKFVCIDSTGGLRYGETLVDDGIESYLYRIDTSLRVTDWSSRGGPLLLQPGRDQRLYFLAMENGGAWRKLQTFTVRAYYRQRAKVL